MDYSAIAFQLLCLVFVAQCSELDITIDDFEIIDGIRVRKDNTVEDKEVQENTVQDVKGKGENNEDVDEDGEEEDIYEDEVTEEDATEEDEEITKHLPTKCHVCRILATELQQRLSHFGKIRKERESKPPVYFKEKKVVLLAMENLCKQMKNYNIRRSQPFRYIKGVKSAFRRQLDDAIKDSKVKEFMFLSSEDEIDDPTGEIHRLQTQCHDLLVKHQDMLIHWFMKTQSRDLTTCFCRKRVLVNDIQDCLDVKFPERKKKTDLKSTTDDNTFEVENSTKNKLKKEEL